MMKNQTFEYPELCNKAIQAVRDAQTHAKEGQRDMAELALAACRIWTRRAEYALSHGGQLAGYDFDVADAGPCATLAECIQRMGPCEPCAEKPMGAR